MTDRDIKPDSGAPAEPTVRQYIISLCDLCVAGEGGICNVPGCSLIRRLAPDIRLEVGCELEIPAVDEKLARIAALVTRWTEIWDVPGVPETASQGYMRQIREVLGG